MRVLATLAGILVCSAGAFGQAAAEATLTHALSTATGAATGKVLGNVSNQVTNRVAGRLGQQTSPAVTRSRVQTVKPGVQNSTTISPAVTTAEPPSGGSLIASIQGAAPEHSCESAAQDSPSKKPDSAQKATACPATTDAHPSEITLPAAK